MPQNKTANAPKTIIPKENPAEKEQAEFKKHTFLYIVFAFKCFSDKEHPLSAGELAQKLELIFPNLPIDEASLERTVRRYLKDYFNFRNDIKNNPPQPDSTYAPDFHADILTTLLGGEIRQREKKYYFHPLLDHSDLTLVDSSIIANRNLHDSEKEYLLNRIDIMTSLRAFYQKLVETEQEPLEELSGFLDSEITFPKKKLHDDHRKHIKEQKNLLSDRNFLNHIHFVYRAIRNKQMITIRYGRYVPVEDSKNSSNLAFEIKPSKKPSILNPYALLMYHGQLYLIATHKGHTNPVHYRIDRIVECRLYTESPESGEEKHAQPVGRELLPKALEPYFEDSEFDQMKYIAEHPLMGAYLDTAKKTTCTLRTTEKGLGLLYDYFGKTMQIRPVSEKTDDSNINKEPLPLYDIMIPNVYDDNLALFCIHHPDMITVIQPAAIREKVRQSLVKALENLDNTETKDL